MLEVSGRRMRLAAVFVSPAEMAVLSAALVLLLAALAGGAPAPGPLRLDEGNWTLSLRGEWMLEFMAPWCPACTSLKDTWSDLAGLATDLGINVAEVDVTSAPGLSGRFLVTALPTIYHVINGEFRQYKGPRDRTSLFSYVEVKKWQATDPVPWWKDPNSIQMSYVSYFFRMSQMLRVVHNVLLETYGLPTWGSYLVFALATILLGSFIGLLMVACIDFIYPQKSLGKRVELRPKPAVENEVMNDDLVDEEAENTEEYDSPTSDEEKNSPPDSEDESESDEGDSEVVKGSPSPQPRQRKNIKAN